MIDCGISGIFPKGTILVSLNDIAGVSGVGTVEQIAASVLEKYLGKNVAIYRSLKFADTIV